MAMTMSQKELLTIIPNIFCKMGIPVVVRPHQDYQPYYCIPLMCELIDYTLQYLSGSINTIIAP